jgi:Flp pilus assembly pilin Flp
VTDRRRIFAVLYYGGLALVLALILLQLLDEVLGKKLATHIGHNSEAYLAALVLAAWIQYARPRLAGTRVEWPVAVLVGAVMLVIGIALIQTHLPSRFRTLNEAFIALAVLIPYVQARRPLSRVLSYGLPGLVLLLVLVVGDRGLVRDLAETATMLIFIPIGLDLVDRGILQSDAVTSIRARWAWYAALVLIPIVFVALRRGAHVGGWAGNRMLYSQRGLEGYIAAFFIEVYFAVFLGWVGRRVTPAHRRSGRTTAVAR